MPTKPRYHVEPKIMWTAICATCGGDVLDYQDSEHVAYTDRESVGEIIGNWDYGTAMCPHCRAPLTDAEAELQADNAADAAALGGVGGTTKQQGGPDAH